MTTRLEKRWWFELVCTVGAALAVQWLVQAAGIAPAGSKAAQMLVWCCCFFTLQRLLSFALWLLVLAVAPRRVIDTSGPSG